MSRKRRLWPYLVGAAVLVAACSPATPKPSNNAIPKQTGPYRVRFIAAAYGTSGATYEWWLGNGATAAHVHGSTNEATFTSDPIEIGGERSAHLIVTVVEPATPATKRPPVFAGCTIQRVLDDGSEVALASSSQDKSKQTVTCDAQL